jgi:NADPH:quinone reductase-like Zn-dependent oxidoreductase
MRAIIISEFGPPSVMRLAEVPQPVPADGQVLVRVHAAGVGPWDAWVRSGRSVVDQPLPLIPGSDISGVVEAVGASVTTFAPGAAIYGATNSRFTNGYAEYAVVEASMIAPKPGTLSHVQAAAVPVIAVTAWQMLFDYAKVSSGQTVLIHAGAGSVGACAVQLARRAGARVIATASPKDSDYVSGLGAAQVIDYHAGPFERIVTPVDAVIDLVGGETTMRSYALIKPGGILVSAANFALPPDKATAHGIRATSMLVTVTTASLMNAGDLIDRGELRVTVGTVLPLDQARTAHTMLEGAPHPRGKIVLDLML